MRRNTIIAATLVALFLSVATGRADFFIEQGQAGSLPATAQQVIGNFPLEGIRGSLLTNNEVDMYAILISNPALFSATTVGTPGTLNDTHLFLFDRSGHGVYANDDANNSTKRSTLPAGDPNGPQTVDIYYLAIASFGRDPISSPTNDLIFPDFPFTGVFGPTGPGGANPISGYKGAGSGSGTYQINLTGVATFPEPSSLLLLGIGLGSVAVARYRRRKPAKAVA